jgi:hypothetical protein
MLVASTLRGAIDENKIRCIHTSRRLALLTFMALGLALTLSCYLDRWLVPEAQLGGRERLLEWFLWVHRVMKCANSSVAEGTRWPLDLKYRLQQ